MSSKQHLTHRRSEGDRTAWPSLLAAEASLGLVEHIRPLEKARMAVELAAGSTLHISIPELPSLGNAV